MKILLIGGMHGNEPLGIELVKKLSFEPHKNVDFILANEIAVDKNIRYLTQDLNRSFPGNATSNNYEKRRAREILNICKGYDIVLDFHNTHCPHNDCSFVGEGHGILLRNISSWLGLKRIIVADYECLNKYASNCLSIEISMNGKRNNADYWYKKVGELSELNKVPTGNVKKYKFVYRITNEDRDRLGLEKQKLKAFKKVKNSIARQLGVNAPAYPIFIGDAFTPYQYGGILNDL